MKKNVGTIEIVYNQELESDIERIVKIIELNSSLFAGYQNKTLDLTNTKESTENRINVTDFDYFFDNLLMAYLNTEDIKESLKTPELLPALYTQMLIKEQQEKDQSEIFLEVTFPEDILLFLVASKYYDLNTQFHEFSYFIRYHNNKKEIMDWLKESQRFPTYNYLLDIATNYLKENDPSFFNHMKEIIKKATSDNFDLIKSKSKSKKNLKIDSMNAEELERTFIDFLEAIKAPAEWKEIYTYLKENNLITYTNEKHQSAVIMENGIRQVIVSDDNTLDTFISLVHEFVHYVAIEKSNNNMPFSLREFPSLYFEKIAAIYLVSIGYNEDIVENTIKTRNDNNYNLYKGLFGIITDILRYNKKGPITLEEKADFNRQVDQILVTTISDLNQILKDAGADSKTLEALEPKVIDYEEAAKEMCDFDISMFIQKGLLVLNGYQYLTDNQLAEAVIDKGNEETTDKMIYVTENLGEFDIDKIISYFELESIYEEEGNKEKIKSHNQNKDS